MSCRTEIEKIAEELSRSGEAEGHTLSRHIASCPECQEKAVQMAEISRLLSGLPMEAPSSSASMWQAVSSRLEPRQAKATRLPYIFSRKWALATAFVFFIGYLIAMPHFAPSESSDAEALLDQHKAIRAVAASTGTDPQAMIQQADLDFEVIRPDLPTGWKLGSISQFSCPRGLPVVHQVYVKQNRKLSIFQKPAGGGYGRGMGMGRGWRGGRGAGGGGGGGRCQMMQFEDGSMAASFGQRFRFFVTGDLPQQDLQSIAENLCQKEETGNGSAR